MSTRAPQFYDFLHFKGCSYLNRKISFNLSVEVAIFLVFHNPFMMLFHILRSVLNHELMLDNFLIPSSMILFLQCSTIPFKPQVRLKTADLTSTSGRRHVADYHSSAADMSKGSVLP